VIRVRENFKGDLNGVVEVRDALSTSAAGRSSRWRRPGRYIVFANLDEGDLVTPAFCPQTQPVNGWKDRLAPAPGLRSRPPSGDRRPGRHGCRAGAERQDRVSQGRLVSR
jgi:hypothetical protein